MRLAHNRRTTARVVLFIVVSVITTLVLFSGGPIGAISFAQQQTTSGTRIEFLNPDESTSAEISAKDDDPGAGTETTYHIVATVNSLPSNYSVTFQYQEDGSAPTTIGNGTLVGADTFELFWPSSAMPDDGAYTLIAILSSGGTEVSRDTEAVTVNNQSDSADPIRDFRNDQGSTVEIVDPGNADGLGFYDAPGGDVVWAASIIVRFSDGTTRLTPYYSVSPPGSEPEFEACGNGNETAANAADGVRCELVSPHTPTQVTGVAVVAADQPIPSPAPADVDSADGHRVTGYVSDPSSVTISGSPTGAVSIESCTPEITATVFDQNGSRVVGANVDVHAQGPNDTLAFDSNAPSENKAPENHATETARDCETDPEAADGEQGWHEAGTQDRKHIESVDGTADNGTFTFRLYSAAPGSTQYTVWADEDSNDRQCANEAQADGAIGWGSTPPAVTGLPDEDTTCTTSTQSPSTSPSTRSPSPTPTQSSASPSPTQSTQSPSPTPTETQKPTEQVPSSVSIKYDKGSPDRFKGSVATSKRKCARNRTVVIFKVKKGRDKKVGTDKTSRGGNYRVTENNARGKYYARVLQKRIVTNTVILNCQRDKSPTTRVR